MNRSRTRRAGSVGGEKFQACMERVSEGWRRNKVGSIMNEGQGPVVCK